MIHNAGALPFAFPRRSVGMITKKRKANYINTLRAQAKALQQQAAAELEQAKQQIEKMILGD